MASLNMKKMDKNSNNRLKIQLMAEKFAIIKTKITKNAAIHAAKLLNENNFTDKITTLAQPMEKVVKVLMKKKFNNSMVEKMAESMKKNV